VPVQRQCGSHLGPQPLNLLVSYLDLLKLASPEAIIVLVALAVLTIGLTNERARTFPAVIAAAGILIAIWTTIRLPQSANLFGGMLVISPLNSLFKIICLVLAFVTVPLAASEKSMRNPGEYLAMLLLGTVGLLLLVGSEELLMIFIGLELLGLSLYIMAAFDKSDVRSAEAGLKYFLFGSTASAFTLFGISLVYGMSGTTALASIAAKIATAPIQPLLAVGIVMTLIGFAFKIAAAPFHLWAPDAYQGAPIPSAAFIASGSKVAAFVVLGKIVLVGFAPAHGNAAWHMMLPGWSPLLAALAALSILLGNFVALAQTNVRRLLAYSAVAHAGYTLLGLVAGGREGFSATLFYTTIYAITLIGAFAVVGMVKRETGGDDFQNFAGLASRSPLASACMSVFMLSLAGLPPLAGFFGKFYLFSAAFRAGGDHGLLWLVVLALFGSFVSLYYYLSVLKVIFIDKAAEKAVTLEAVGPNAVQQSVMAILAASVLLLGVLPETLASAIAKSVP
jgi:NADH-quinone oxidoreductase subunit N